MNTWLSAIAGGAMIGLASGAGPSGGLRRAAHLYRNGWRTFYATIATGAWLVGGWMMLVTTVIIVAIDITARIE